MEKLNVKEQIKIPVQIEQEVNNVVVTDVFALSKSPTAYQLTKHVTNMIETYGNSAIKEFKDYLHNPETLLTNMSNFRTRQIINHYGIKTCQKWFTDIYGWDFKKEVA